MTKQVVLELREVGMVYPRDGMPTPLRVIDGISAVVRRGDLVVVAGRSGSGKTTLLNIAAALLAPTSGSVSWETRSSRCLPPRPWPSSGHATSALCSRGLP